RPAHELAALVLDVEEEPRMRIREAHLDDLAGDRDRLVHVVERGERMMGRNRRNGADRHHSRGQRGCTYTLHNGPPRDGRLNGFSRSPGAISIAERQAPGARAGRVDAGGPARRASMADPAADAAAPGTGTALRACRA